MLMRATALRRYFTKHAEISAIEITNDYRQHETASTSQPEPFRGTRCRLARDFWIRVVRFENVGHRIQNTEQYQ